MPQRRSTLLLLFLTLWTASGAIASEAASADSESSDCLVRVEPGKDFGPPAALSDPEAIAASPALAVAGDQVLIAWQETVDGQNRVRWALATDGCVGATHALEDPLPNPRLPSVAATASGFVLAYEAQDPPEPLVRFVFLDAEGGLASEPETLSAPGEIASRVQVAANGDDIAFAWTDVHDHHIARRGPVERLPPTAIGSLIDAPGLINYPRLALSPDGTLYVAYRDGGPRSTDYEVLLLVREAGGDFERPINVSETTRQMSDDVALAVEADGRLRMAWVEQNPQRPEFFGVVHATYDRSTGLGEVSRFGSLAMPSARPSVARGLATVWQTGQRIGALFFAPGPEPPLRIMPEYQGRAVVLVGDPADTLHLAFVDDRKPPRLRYAVRRVE